jgi:soluble lytic murein transglycosylase
MKSIGRSGFKQLSGLKYFLLLAIAQLFTPSASATSAVEQFSLQRGQYQATLNAISKGHKNDSESFSSYPLHNYLLKAQLQKKLRTLPYDEVDNFLASERETVAARQLLYSWLRVLAKKKQWQQFLSYYDSQLNSNTLRCWQLEALHQTGHSEQALNKTEDLWLVGKSQPKACDTPFKRWQQAGRINDSLLWQRANLAIDEKNYTLARFLISQGSAELEQYGNKLLKVNRKPSQLARQENFNPKHPYDKVIAARGLKRLANKDIKLASKLWIDYRHRYAFSQTQFDDIRQAIARQLIASNSPQAMAWLIANDPNAEDSYLLEWRIRLALKQQHWHSTQRWIKQLPQQEQQSSRWRYWLARATEQTASTEIQAMAMYRELATERTYYGFLAADILGDRYGLNHSPLSVTANADQITQIAAIQRAHEFYQLGELTPARREWYNAISVMDPAQLNAASNLAHQWGWHQQAIQTTIKAQQWDDLAIRFPMAYQPNMLASAKVATISPDWLYAIARQESAFASDARSPVGARGLMQLMPSTAKKVAQSMGVPYRSADLYKPKTNISLGSEYLRQLLEDFNGNHILATAAYNAGPHRVKKWLARQQGSVEYDIWIETLPYYETRDYVQNILAFKVIYGLQMGMETSLISKDEFFIGRLDKQPDLANIH